MRIRLIGGSVAIALDARQHGERGKLLSVSGTGSGACSGGRHQRKQGTALCDGCLLYALGEAKEKLARTTEVMEPVTERDETRA